MTGIYFCSLFPSHHSNNCSPSSLMWRTALKETFEILTGRRQYFETVAINKLLLSPHVNGMMDSWLSLKVCKTARSTESFWLGLCNHLLESVFWRPSPFPVVPRKRKTNSTGLDFIQGIHAGMHGACFMPKMLRQVHGLKNWDCNVDTVVLLRWFQGPKLEVICTLGFDLGWNITIPSFNPYIAQFLFSTCCTKHGNLSENSQLGWIDLNCLNWIVSNHICNSTLGWI